MILIITKKTSEEIDWKAGALADDVGAMCRSDSISVHKVFPST